MDTITRVKLCLFPLDKDGNEYLYNKNREELFDILKESRVLKKGIKIMLIRNQSGKMLVNLDNVLCLYATEYGAVMVRTIGDQNFAIADYETEEEALSIIENITQKYLSCNSGPFLRNEVYELPERPRGYSRSR